MTRKQFFKIAADGVCWLVFWVAVFGIGRFCWRVAAPIFPRIHISIDWRGADGRGSSDQSINKFIKKTFPTEKTSDGLRVFAEVQSKLGSGELLGFEDGRSELLALSEGVSPEWFVFTEQLLARFDKDNFKEELRAAVKCMQKHIPAVELLTNIVEGCENADVIKVADRPCESDSQEDCSDDSALVPDGQDQGVADGDGEGSGNKEKPADSQSDKPDRNARKKSNQYQWRFF